MNRTMKILMGLLISAGGTFLLFSASSRNNSTSSSASTRAVVVAIADIPQSTPLASLTDKIKVEQVPLAMVPPDAIESLAAITAGFVTNAPIKAGEQLMLANFVPASSAAGQSSKGLQEVTITLTNDRALGGGLVQGDRVAVIASFSGDTQGTTTSFVVRDALVSSISYGADAGANPAGQAVVTLSVKTADATRLIYSAEFGKVWLARESAEVDLVGAAVTTRDEILSVK